MLTVPVFLTEEESKRFISFQKRYAFVGFLESINAFDMRDTSLTLHFDHYGQIKTVEKKETYHI
jgi:hypothetical protein